ncbi:ABC-F family ATP-binding cassette domain-containing protein [Primorskyibacter flagellatus]|nr:ABC-F family ATP-binding cassette domain-containing protein [Primorskyibacter flagellatus]
MPAYLTISDLTVAAPDGTILLDNLSLTFGPGLTGIVGRNGCGKSTLLNILSGDAAPMSGAVHRSGGCHLLTQDTGPSTHTAAFVMGIGPAHAAIRRLMDGRGDTQDAALADWTLPDRLSTALDRVGMAGADLTRAMGSFSGGERMRLLLAGALLSGAEVLLADEPTNNLDAAGRALVRDIMTRWTNPVILVSHDRELLDHADRIIDLDSPGAEVVTGGWTRFAEERDARRARAVEALTRSEAVARREKAERQAQREKQDQSRARGRQARSDGSMPKMWHDAQAERAQQTRAKAEAMRSDRVGAAEDAREAAAEAVVRLVPPRMTLPESGLPRGRAVLRLHAIRVRRGDRTVGPVSLDITGPERVAVAGANGVGKSTLLQVIAGEVVPDDGCREVHARRIARLDQDFAALGSGGRLIDAVRRLRPDVADNDLHAALARFGFRNTEAETPLAGLSGGERLRAGLMAAFAGDPAPDLLLLDEPTNHLDVLATEALEQALSTYDGALVVVSHDARFLAEIGVTRRIGL